MTKNQKKTLKRIIAARPLHRAYGFPRTNVREIATNLLYNFTALKYNRICIGSER